MKIFNRPLWFAIENGLYPIGCYVQVVLSKSLLVSFLLVSEICINAAWVHIFVSSTVRVCVISRCVISREHKKVKDHGVGSITGLQNRFNQRATKYCLVSMITDFFSCVIPHNPQGLIYGIVTD